MPTEKCPIHEGFYCGKPDVCAAEGCQEEARARQDAADKEEFRKAAANAALTKVMRHIESLDDAQQTKVIECGLRLRELACYYGPYFSLALTLTGCEIAAGALVMPATAECDRTDILLPGLKTAEQLTEIVLPDGFEKH